MLPFEKILFPVDFSEQSRGAAHYVEAFTGRFKAALTLLSASDPHYNDLLPDDVVQRRHRLETFFGKEFEYDRVERVLAEGEPAANIVGLANSGHFDLIMMPTHGLGGFRRFLIGSVTAKVLHDADCPVWTGVHLEQAPSLEKIVFKNFLCAVNMQPYSKTVIDCAVELADEYRANLTVAHVVPAAVGVDAIKQQIAEWLGPAAERAAIRVESGEVATAIAVLATETDADLLVIGRNPAPGVFGRLRTDAYSVIRQSPCPVISV
jgi:nucleotide-binding universal stress UspA family protein